MNPSPLQGRNGATNSGDARTRDHRRELQSMDGSSGVCEKEIGRDSPVC